VPPKGHKQSSDRVEFCRVPDCKKTEYRDSCAVDWRSQAHHLLCVSYVNAAVSKAKGEVKKVVDQSKWCINDKNNMLALPIWGTTVLYYCADFKSVARKTAAAVRSSLAEGLKNTETDRPAFADLPQHNYGHSGETSDQSYNLEVKKKLKTWIAKIQVNIQKHSVTGDSVHKQLENMSNDMRGKLEERGRRVGSTKGTKGTHAAWLHPAPNWYLPFSMAKKPKPMPAPKMTQRIIDIAQALWRT
jgi:hypothetical protein